MNNLQLRQKLSEYCEAEAFSITRNAGLPEQHITNNNYTNVRQSIYLNLPRHKVNAEVYRMTALLAFVSIVGYPS